MSNRNSSREESPYDWFFAPLLGGRTKFKPAEIKIFRYLISKRNKTATMKELCAFMPASTVSVTVNELNRDGFVDKIPEMASDGSLYVVKLLYIPKAVRSYLIPTPRGPQDVNSIYYLENIRSFQRIFRFAEADLRRKIEGTDIHFLLDFSEVHDFLHPDINHLYPSVGWVVYMFERKLEGDNYIFPPPAAWEMLRHMERTAKMAEKYADFGALTDDLKIKKFLDVIKHPPQNPEWAYRKLVREYKGIRELVGLMMLADRKLVKELFPKAIRRFKTIVEEKLLVPLSSVVDDYDKYNVDSKVYMKVLDYLMWTRLKSSEKNVVDAMNMGLTFQLTDSLYKSSGDYFTLVTHSRKPLEVFYDVEWPDDPKDVRVLVREPSFMATRILLENEFPDERILSDYVTQGKEITEYLWQNRDLLDYSERFIQTFDLPGEKIIKDELTPVSSLLNKIKIYERNYAPRIHKILKANVEKIKRLPKITLVKRMEKVRELAKDQEEYTNRMMEAHDIVMESVKETYEILRNFVGVKYGNLLTPQMLDWLEKLDQEV